MRGRAHLLSRPPCLAPVRACLSNHWEHAQQLPPNLACLRPCRYICKALASRLPDAAARARFVDPSALLLGARSSMLVAPLGPHGSLQELVNAYLARGQVLSSHSYPKAF